MSAPRIIGVNGIRSHGEANTDLLLGELRKFGHEVVDFDYGRVGFFAARNRSRQKAIGHRLHEASRDGDHVVAHSYGCLVALRAMQAGARFGIVWLIAPAMDADFTFPAHGAREIHIVSSPTDLALLGGTMLLRHDFGPMGLLGYQGPPDSRVRNHYAGPKFRAHSAYFKPGDLEHWAAKIHATIPA